jgi:tripartite-type tricarboxylate transporter receptor subunit TctC
VLTRLAALVVAGVLGHGGLAHAQHYPNRPVKIVVPFPAGGGTDALTRFAARGMEQRLGQPVIIENRGGAGTTLGATAVARSEPDGYTIMVGTASTFAAAPGLYKRLAYDPAKDFSPIMLFATVPFVVVGTAQVWASPFCNLSNPVRSCETRWFPASAATFRPPRCTSMITIGNSVMTARPMNSDFNATPGPLVVHLPRP